MTKSISVPISKSRPDFKQANREMFNGIAHRYDFLNHFLSLGIDKLWRRKVSQFLKPFSPKTILDVATGTGDLALECLSLYPTSIIGIDVSANMLEIGKRKVEEKKLDHIISLQEGDSENIPFPDNTFDALTVSFGVRNFSNLPKGLSEMNRVLKVNAPMAILEFSKPKHFLIRKLFGIYFSFILPFLGKIISGNNVAYSYLHESVQIFPEGDQFLLEMKKAGLKNLKAYRLTFGIATLYTGTKQ